MRYTVRKVSVSWMVWDTATQTVAMIDDIPAVGLSELGALRVADMLNSQDKLTTEAEAGPSER